MRVQIAYAGASGSGKTETLRSLQRAYPGSTLAVIDRDGNGPLPVAFECLTAKIAHSGGQTLELVLFTVPNGGDEATRRRLLGSATGAIFVCDDRGENLDANREALEALEADLSHLGRERLPRVVQWNRRGQENSAASCVLEGMLNPGQFSSVETDALTGDGLRKALRLLMRPITEPQKTEAVAELPPLTHNPLPDPASIPTEPWSRPSGPRRSGPLRVVGSRRSPWRRRFSMATAVMAGLIVAGFAVPEAVLSVAASLALQ